jgi:hypothetical protein
MDDVHAMNLYQLWKPTIHLVARVSVQHSGMMDEEEMPPMDVGVESMVVDDDGLVDEQTLVDREQTAAVWDKEPLEQ